MSQSFIPCGRELAEGCVGDTTKRRRRRSVGRSVNDNPFDTLFRPIVDCPRRECACRRAHMCPSSDLIKAAGAPGSGISRSRLSLRVASVYCQRLLFSSPLCTAENGADRRKVPIRLQRELRRVREGAGATGVGRAAARLEARHRDHPERRPVVRRRHLRRKEQHHYFQAERTVRGEAAFFRSQVPGEYRQSCFLLLPS